MADKFKGPITIEVDPSDEGALEKVARELGTTPQEVKHTIEFSHEIFANAELHELSKGQLVTALMSVITLLIRDAGGRDEQRHMCVRLTEGMWASVGLELQNMKDVGVLLTPQSKNVH